MSLVAVNDTEAQWEAHFRDMAEGKLANVDYYTVSVNQIGKGDGKLPKEGDKKILGPTHDPTTGRLLDPISVAANQTTEQIKSMKPQFETGIKSADVLQIAPKKKRTKKKKEEEKPVTAKEESEADSTTGKPKRKRRKKKGEATTFVGPDILSE